MQQGIKRGLAAVLSAVLTVSLLLNTFSIGVFAQDDPTALTEQIVAQLEQEGVEPGSGATEETPAVSAVPTQQPEATVEPTATAWPEATETPEPSAVPEPSASAEPTETPVPTVAPAATESPAPTVTPAPTATAVPEQDSRQLTVEELKQQIKDLLEQSYSLTEMTEEELEESLGEINAIAAMPATMAEEDQEDAELQELLDQLADAQAAMESMRMAWQAKREGWLDQLPQTGKENSWRYQNGTRIDQDENILDFDVPDGVSTFSAGGYWGIDVSHHQGVINWEAVKAAGIDFAIIRCGYGMNLTEQDDRQWSRNVSECERLGIPYGVYFYSYAMTADMAVEEGAHAVRLLEGHNPDLPVFYDLEENSQLVLGSGGLAEIARIFCDIVGSKGYEVGVYASLNWWQYYLTDAVFENWYRWVAEWRSSCHYNGRYEMWQYTSKGSINGISGNVDMNYWYGPLGENEKDYEAVYNYEYYISHNPDLSSYTREQAFQHFIKYGMAEGRQGNEEFNVVNYRARYADLFDWLGNDLKQYYLHYKDYGKAEGRDAQTYCRLTRYEGQDYSAVYNYDYYTNYNLDLYGWSDYDAIKHFVEHGMAEGRQGNAEFNVCNYRARYADLFDWLGNDLKQYYLHYKDYGKAEGRDAQTYCRLTRYEGQEYSAVYSYDYYTNYNLDLYGWSDYDAIKYFVEHGMAEGQQGNEEFNVVNYRARYADLFDWLGNDLKQYYLHYKDYGKAEGRDAQTYCRLTRYEGQDYSAVYSYDYYTNYNLDLYGWSDYDAIKHFVEYGMAEGRQGNAEFNVYNYRARYVDLCDWLGNDLKQYYVHYKDYGKDEGRDAQSYCRLTRYEGQDYSVVYNYDYYTNYNLDLYGWSDYDALKHFVEYGMAEGRQASAEFNVYVYRNRYDDLSQWLQDNLKGYFLHYMNFGKEEGRIAV